MAKASRLNKKKIDVLDRSTSTRWHVRECLTVHFIYSLCRRYCPNFIVTKIFTDERFIFLIIRVQVQLQSGNFIIPYHQLVSLSTCQKTLCVLTFSKYDILWFTALNDSLINCFLKFSNISKTDGKVSVWKQDKLLIFLILNFIIAFGLETIVQTEKYTVVFSDFVGKWLKLI